MTDEVQATTDAQSRKQRYRRHGVSRLPAGYVCTCGQRNGFPMYVYAHMRDILKGECDSCGRRYKVIMARASPARARKGDPKDTEHFYSRAIDATKENTTHE